MLPLILITVAAACSNSGETDDGGDGGDDRDEAVTGASNTGGDVGTDDDPTTKRADERSSGASLGSTDLVRGLGRGDGTFELREETFVDDSRPTSADIATRTLPTYIYVPGGEGPFPLVMHAHGMDGTAAKFSQLLGHWARSGYIVVAPDFPRTNGGAPEELRDLGDYVNQPGDVTFVLDRVLEMSGPGGPLAGLIAQDHIGISGLSLGGATTYPLLFNSRCRDDRYVSAILMSALELPFEGHPYDYSRRIPVLAFAGTDDTSIPYELQQEVISRLSGPKWNVTLPGGQHSPPFENTPSPQDELVMASTVDFWDLTLRGDDSAAARLVADASVEGLAFVDVTD